jgi:hypothetical protein
MILPTLGTPRLDKSTSMYLRHAGGGAKQAGQVAWDACSQTRGLPAQLVMRSALARSVPAPSPAHSPGGIWLLLGGVATTSPPRLKEVMGSQRARASADRRRTGAA